MRLLYVISRMAGPRSNLRLVNGCLQRGSACCGATQLLAVDRELVDIMLACCCRCNVAFIG